MDKYDPEKRVGLIEDEWGVWHDPEPGFNPAFLYQQNTLRDALAAGITLNIFNQHCDRVKMANIAQMINVLQSMILTDKEKMIVTPTYHVFDLYAVHQDATWLPTDLHAADYQFGAEKIPSVSVSVSRDRQGKIHATFCNLNPNRPAEVACELPGARAQKLSGRVLTAPEMNAHNTFEDPNAVKLADFSAFKVTAGGFAVTLPPKSIVLVAVE
jgi:alpha-N-arabinofuranosidase